jgi:nucleoside-triphosphatase THEP1
MSLENLYFGKDDAERDYTNSGLLKEGFLKTSMYNDAQKGSKSLIIGRKGSGKSAICLMLHENFLHMDNSYSSVITPDAISADELRRFELLGINEEQAKKLVWRYVFLVQIAKFILQISKNRKDSSDELNKVREFLIANNEINDLTFQEKFWKIIHKIKASITLSAFGQEIEVETSKTPNEGIQVESKLEYLQNFLINQLKQAGSEQLYLLVDKVDEIWNNDSWSDLMVISLLMAAKEINERIPKVSCIVFLRKDVYDILKFHDRDKFRGDEIHLSWTTDSLEQLIVLRASASLNVKLDKNKFWGNYFAPSVQGTKTSAFIINRTLKRPRDIIQFCNLCRDNATVNRHATVTEEDILQATDVYSSWKINDLTAEWKVNYPFLNDLFILFSNSSFLIQRARFTNLFKQIRPTLNARYPDFSNHLTEDGVLNILYSIGFIGIERMNSSYYYYDDPKTVEFKDTLFTVHPCFRNALKCTSSINVQPFHFLGQDNQNFMEADRGRSASRFSFENARSSKNIYSRMEYSMESFLEVTRKDNLPSEIVNEIAANVGEIRRQIEEMDFNGDYFSFEILRRSTMQYFDNLNRRLREGEFVSLRSDVVFALDRLQQELRLSSPDDRAYFT